MASMPFGPPGLRVAVEGCGHGTLNNIYESVTEAAGAKGWNGVDLVIIGGDFQAVRNSHDMACMAVPSKYKEIGDFHEYYSGARLAPYLTIFVGGNHEASNHLSELFYGGWVAPNIYYLGAANIIRCGPLRIAGFSGIWKGYDYRAPHFERLPYDYNAMHSIYHVREMDVRKLLQVRTQVDIGLSHDWPQGIEWVGNHEYLFHKKPHFIDDAQKGRLGSIAARYVLDRLRPAYWFSAHLHIRYEAFLEHGTYNPPRTISNNIKGRDQQSSRIDPALEAAAKQEIKTQEDKDTGELESTNAELATNPEKGVEKDDNQPQESVQDRISAWKGFFEVASKREAEENAEYLRAADEFRRRVEAGEIEKPKSHIDYQMTWKKVVTDDGVSREVTDIIRTRVDSGMAPKDHETPAILKNEDEIDIDMDSASDTAGKAEPDNGTSNSKTENPVEKPVEIPTEKPIETPIEEEKVSNELRNQLPASFRKPEPMKPIDQIVQQLPDAITNKTTNFLSLDKCLPNRQFIELIEISSISESETSRDDGPYQLEYDKEWLAITRVFSEGFTIGDKTATIPADKGQAVYEPDIIAAEAWVEENIVKPGKLVIPQNFSLTAPIYDPTVPVDTHEQPVEYLNPQTAQFCEMLRIPNPFELSEEQREAQNVAIQEANAKRLSAPEGSHHRRHHNGRRGGRGRHGGGNRGGRGGRGGRGRGRGY